MLILNFSFKEVKMKPFNVIIFLIILNGLSSELSAQLFYSENPLVSTYSIVAMDPETGEMGVAVQSHWFSVGTIVTWGEAGVGVIATQSFVNPAFTGFIKMYFITKYSSLSSRTSLS